MIDHLFYCHLQTRCPKAKSTVETRVGSVCCRHAPALFIAHIRRQAVMPCCVQGSLQASRSSDWHRGTVSVDVDDGQVVSVIDGAGGARGGVQAAAALGGAGREAVLAGAPACLADLAEEVARVVAVAAVQHVGHQVNALAPAHAQQPSTSFQLLHQQREI